MEALVLLLLLALFIVFVLPIVAIVKSADAQGSARNNAQQLLTLQIELRQLRQAAAANEARIRELTLQIEALQHGQPAAPHAPEPPPPAVAPSSPLVPPAPEPVMEEAKTPPKKPSPEALEPPAPRPPARQPAFTPVGDRLSAPAPRHPQPLPEPPPSSSLSPLPTLNLEQFMGAKLFAWIGGLALFFGIAFFIKYSVEQNLIPPAVRATFGFLAGLGLLTGGLLMKRKETAVTAQTLCSTGILVLYGVTFACKALYHFRFFGAGTTFLLMAAVTATAFVLSVRLNAMVVAVLGIAGGFLTPVLLSTGQDAPLTLFGYIALLDIGLLAVSLRQRWAALPILGAIGTVAMQAGWITRFFLAGQYATGNRVLIPMAVFLGFQALFLAAAAWGKRTGRANAGLGLAALLSGAAAMTAAGFFLSFSTLGHRPVLLLGYTLLADLGLIALVFADQAKAKTEIAAQWAAFLLLALWTHFYFGRKFLWHALAAYLVFALIHLALPVLLRRRALPVQAWPLYALPVLVLPFFFGSLPVFVQNPAAFFGTFLLVSFAALCAALADRASASVHAAAGLAGFLLLARWTSADMTPAHLPIALILFFVFALFHTLAPLAIRRLRGTPLPWWCSSVPALALVLILIPIFRLSALSFLVWPLVLLLDILAVMLAVLTAALLPILAVLVLTLLALGAWLLRIPAELTGLPLSLALLGGFSLFFIAAAAWAVSKLTGTSKTGGNLFGEPGDPANLAVQIPALSVTMPFLLLLMVTLRLPLANPTPVFALACVLVLLLLGLARFFALDALPLIGLACAAALQHTWLLGRFHPAYQSILLAWNLVFYAAFTLFPFLFHRKFAEKTLPWAAAALAGPAHFLLVCSVVTTAFPIFHSAMGLIPAAFALPALAGLALIHRRTPSESPARMSQMAWFGGVTLFFLTLIFPIQFEKQWITVGWALEGAALCWLFRRIPHPGLRATGVALLAVAFARLSLNPAILAYHARSSMPILNWYLYSYGIVIASLFAGAALLAPPRHRIAGRDIRPLLCTFGTILAFLLVNIEIADFFSQPGERILTFQFSGNFARDMSYSIAWALFALILLIAGILRRNTAARYASLWLLAITLLKLFFHDLSQLEQLYRIAAFIVVAAIAMLASFLYQRFLGEPPKSADR